jgi:hypothetical protein
MALPVNGWDRVQYVVSNELERHDKLLERLDTEVRDMARALLECKAGMETAEEHRLEADKRIAAAQARENAKLKLIAGLAGPAGAAAMKIIEALM